MIRSWIANHRYVTESIAASDAQAGDYAQFNKLIVTLALLSLTCLCSVRSWAQIHQEGQTAVELSAGALDGFKLPGQDNFGFFAGLSYSQYRTRYTYWKGTFHLNQKYYAYDRTLVPVSQWLGEGTYFTRVLGLVGRSWLVNVGGGLAGGYESINQGRRTVEGASLLNRSNWVVGPTLAIEGEYILSGRTILTARAQEYYLFRSSVAATRFNVGVGIKIILPTDFE